MQMSDLFAINWRSWSLARKAEFQAPRGFLYRPADNTWQSTDRLLTRDGFGVGEGESVAGQFQTGCGGGGARHSGIIV